MKITTLAPALALAALSLAACTPKTDAANNDAAAADTLTLNEEGDAALDNGGDFAAGNALAADNAVDENTLAPAAGNAL